MITVAVSGAAGRMGQEVCRAVLGADDLELAGMVDPRLEGAAVGAPDDWPVAGDLRASIVEAGAHPVAGAEVTALDGVSVDILVDFTEAAAARRTLPWCAAHGVHAVVHTGLGERDLAELARLFDGGLANAVVVPNFAIGAVLLMRFSELAAPFMDGVEVIELHHDQKHDAPSGTALRTAERIVAAREAAGAGPLPADPTTEVVLASARGAESPGGVRIHSVRLPGLVAHQEVVFGALGQSLTLRHDSYDRRSFMPGVLLAVRHVGGRPGLTVGLEVLLGL